MKGNDKILAVLNKLLADELTAINQYMVHAEMCANWGYHRLHKAIEHQAIEEMKHAEWLIARILFLEGTPIVSKLNKIRIGKTVEDMVNHDYQDELDAVRSYNAGIRLAHEVDDQSTVDLLTKILKMEEDHVDWGEMQRDQIAQMGIQHYLAQQIDKAE